MSSEFHNRPAEKDQGHNIEHRHRPEDTGEHAPRIEKNVQWKGFRLGHAFADVPQKIAKNTTNICCDVFTASRPIGWLVSPPSALHLYAHSLPARAKAVRESA